MKQEKLIVKNFFTLRDIDIDLTKFNVFIGEQASGKSLLLKLIYVCRKILVLPIQNNVSNGALIGLINEYFNDIFKLDSGVINTNLKIIYSIKNEFSITILYENNKLRFVFSDKLLHVYRRHSQKMFSTDIPGGLRGSIQRLEVSIQSLKEIGLDFDIIEGLPLIPAGRTFLVTLHRNIYNIIKSINSANKIDELLLNFGQSYLDSIESFDTLNDKSRIQEDLINKVNIDGINWYDKKFSQILKGKYKFDQVGGYIEQESGSVRPWNSSSGQQETLPIYLVLRGCLQKNRPSNIYIEEPEAHLYPTAQKDILELLVYVANTISSEGLYITTHSPYILTVLNNLIMANDVKDKQTDFGSNLLVPFEEVRAYFITDGQAYDLRDHENRLVNAYELDKVSEQNSIEFDKLLDLKYDK